MASCAGVEMNLTQRPEVAGLRTSVVCEHIRNPHPAGPRVARVARGTRASPRAAQILRTA
jgi:hypothetical protein